MNIPRIAASAASLVIASSVVSSVALAALSVRMLVNGQSHSVRAVQVGGAWFVDADDVARALGNGAAFDAHTRTLYASAADRAPQPRLVNRLGGGFASDGTVAARLISIKRASSFQGNAPDPGAHFVFAIIELKNVSNAPVDLYRVQTSLVAGSQHLNDGQFYDRNGGDLPLDQTAPGKSATYMDVFELDDGVTADAILVHPPFAPTTAPIDMILKL